MKQKFLNLVLATMLLCFVSPAFAQVAKIGDAEYAQLSEAISAATDGQTIVLTADVSQSVTINKNLTIDGDGKTYTGKMTIKKGLFVTVNNVNFNGNKAYDYGIVCEDINILTIENSTAKDFKTGFVYFKAGDKVNVNGVTVENVAAAFNVSRSNNSTFENVTLKNVTYGLHVQNYDERTYTLKNWTVENTDYITYVQNKDTKVVTFQLEGDFEIGNAKLHESQYAKYNKNINVVANVAKIGEQGYEKLADAVAAATAGQTITLIADVNENVTISKSVTIDGAGKQYIGTMTVNKDLTVTVENVNFVNGGIDKPKAQKSTTGTYTIKNCTFVDEGKYAYPLRFYGAATLNVENCTVKNYLYSFLYINGSTLNLNINNVTVEDCPNYAVYFATGVNNANIEGLTVKNANNGLIINNAAARKLTIKDCKMENVATAINHSGDYTNAINVTANGAIDFGGAAISQYVKFVGGTAVVAKVGEVNYLSLADAVAAVQAGETVELVNDATGAGVVINKDITIDFAGKTYTFNKTVGSAGTTTLGLQILKDNNVTLKNGTLTSTAVVAGKEVKMLIQNYANLTLQDMNIVDNTEHILYALSNNCGETLLTGNTNITTDAVAFDSYKDNAYTAPTVTVETTGKIAGKIEKSDGATIAIKSGIFTVAIDPTWCAAGYVPVDNGDGTYTVAEAAVPVAEVGGKTYSSLIAAFAAAQNGETVTLVADIELTSADVVTTPGGYNGFAVVEGKSITFDMNGKKISVNHQSTTNRIYSVIFIADGASLTVTGNGTIDVDADDNAPKVAYVFWKRGTTGTLVIENGNFHADNTEDSMVYTNGSGIVTVNGGTFSLDSVGTRVNKFPCIFNTAGNNERFITVDGGTYNYDISNQHWIKEVQLVEGKITADNGDGTWTVVPGYDELTIVHADWAGRDFVNENDMPVNTLNYVRNFSKTTWQTFYVPFAINYDDIKADFDVKRLEMAHEVENNDGEIEVEFEFVSIKDGQKLKANYPYLIRVKEPGLKTITVENATLKKTVSRSIDCSTVDHKFTFTGTYDYISGQEMVDNNRWSMSSGKLFYATNPAKHSLNPFSWYMEIEGREDLSDVKFVFGGDFEDEETTGITNIDNDQIKNDGNIYDLQGRRVLQPQKGSLYIVNGKKVVF